MESQSAAKRLTKNKMKVQRLSKPHYVYKVMEGSRVGETLDVSRNGKYPYFLE